MHTLHSPRMGVGILKLEGNPLLAASVAKGRKVANTTVRWYDGGIERENYTQIFRQHRVLTEEQYHDPENGTVLDELAADLSESIEMIMHHGIKYAKSDGPHIRCMSGIRDLLGFDYTPVRHGVNACWLREPKVFVNKHEDLLGCVRYYAEAIAEVSLEAYWKNAESSYYYD